MDGVDPDTLLEWLQTGTGEERDLQLMALEQLCMLLLMSDNIDRCFEHCPPRTFIPALCKIFLDETAPENCLEVTARAITYYLDVSNECTRRITQVEGAVKAICNRLAVAEMSDRTSKDLAEQCVKLLEHVCQRETTAVYEAGGLQCMLHLIGQQSQYVHKDTLHSAMNVVTRLCSKMEPQDPTLPKCSADLGGLLGHDDPKVSECALRCFAALTDRFVRKSLDPVDLATPSRLVDHLLSSLVSTQAAEAPTDASAVPLTRPSSSFTSIVLSLISNLCRGSAKVTDQVIRSPELIPALRSVLGSKDERVQMDSLRLADLLLILLCEGRASLPRNAAALAGSEPAAPTGVERAHRYLIDAIRQKDTDALIDAVESGTVDPNFTDDVGQTLLNWCSAFGTADMAIYLCDKGADVNKGQRSSSLHYAACFGRPDIVKILLRNGANPDLRDEEGRTALDKARERNDEGHQQVVQVLESPSSYMMDRSSQSQGRSHGAKEKPETAGPADEPVDPVIAKSILQQLIPVFCNIFKSTLVSGVRRSTLTLIRKCILSISNEALHEMLSTSSPQDDDQADLVESLMEVLITVFDHEEDMDGQEQVLLVLKSLLTKDSDFWLEQIVRLGVFDKVEVLAAKSTGARNDNENATTDASSDASVPVIDADEAASARSAAISVAEANKENAAVSSVERTPLLNIPVQSDEDSASNAPATPTSTISTQSSTRSSGHHGFAAGVVEAANAVAEALGIQIEDEITQRISSSTNQDDTWNVAQGIHYKWKDWRLIRTADSLFLWCDAVAIEFSDGSNGWLRFLMDGKLYTMYSSGSPEAGADNPETRAEFVSKLQKAKAAVPAGTPTRTIFSDPTSGRAIDSGNWVITCTVPNELVIKNQEGSQQRLLIKEDLPGFIFESNKHSRQSFTAESTLGLDFVTGWAARGGGRRLQFRTEAQRQKIHDLARDVWENYLKEARTKPRDALLELQRASTQVEQFVKKLDYDAEPAWTEENVQKLQETLEVVRNSLTNDRLLSTFEISVSGAVPAILALVSAALNSKNSIVTQCFREVFVDPRDFSSLVRKMVLVLESVEKFPQCLYDAPGGSAFGLQLLTRRLRFRLELADANSEHQKQLLDRTNRTMKSEPLTTVGSLKSFIHRMVAKRWYDYPREDFDFVKKLQEIGAKKERISLTYESDFDDKGVIWWLGTNGKSSSEWVNPASVGVVNVVCSDGAKQPYGQPEDILSRDVSALNCHTTDSPDASFTIDLGVLIYPTAYTLRHSRGYGRSALRNWLLQASRDNHVWDFLVAHSDDQSLNEPGSTATWPIACETGQGPYRYIRIAQNGKNSSGVTYYLSLSGFEIYGDIVDVVEKLQPMEVPQSTCSFGAKDKAAASMPWSKKSGRRYPTATSSSTVPKTLGGVHAARPPTAAAALRAARKQQSAFEKPSKSPGSNNRSFGFDADPLYGQLPGGAANHKLAAGYSLASLLGQSSSRNKGQRYRRSNRNYAEAGPPSLPDAPAADFMPQIPIGTRVIPGPHWRWGSVTNRQGTVTAVGNPDGWVDVEWDDGTSNSYRYGDGGKREIEMLSAASSSRPSLFSARGQRDSFFRANNQLGIASRPSVVVKQAPHTADKPPRSRAERKEESPNFLSSKTANNPATASLRDEQRSQANASAATNGSGASSSMSQKSMSTTNLFDGKKEVPRSVASTNQAASAESLQHQTPSLENLLARSRIYGEGIPEAVGDEQSPSDGPMDVTTSAESIESSAHAISVAASSFAGGSQPALSPKTSFAHQQESLSAASSANALSDDVMRTNRDVVSSPREHPSSERTLDEAMDDGVKNLSVSAPNLAVGRQRQRVSVGSGTSGPVENNLLFLEEEEPSETDEANESLSDIKEEAFEPLRDSSSNQPASEPQEEDGIVDIEPDEDNDALDDEFLNKLIRSRDFFGLVDAYSEELALAENDLNEENHGSGQPLAGAASAQGSSANAASSRRPLSSLFGGSGIRSKLGNYAEVIRNMMQQMMDSGSISGFDSDEIDIRLTDDVYDEDDITDEGNDNEDCDDFALSSQVESLASAAAALRRQFSTASASSQNAASNSQNSSMASSEKLNWRQLVMSEAGRFLYDVAGSGNSSNAGETSAASLLGGDSANTGGRNNKRTVNRTWDDDFVLRRQFGALIPAFDPRPGRTNINQTQDVELPENDVELPPLNHHRNSLMYSSSNTSISGSHSSKIRLYLKGPNLADVPNAVVELDEDDATIFAFVQKLLSLSEWGQKLDKCRRVWEPTYTIIYENPLPDGERSTIEVTKGTNKEVVPESGSLIRQTLDVLKQLNVFADVHQVDVPQDAFLSTKLTQKLTQELTDCLVVSARALPEWCSVLVYEYPCLFACDTRSMHLRSSAFGTSRAIVWLQNRRDQLLEQTRSSGAGAGSNLAGSRREDHYPEYRIGRIRHERIKVHRNDELLLENAIKVMKFHATRKSVLEIEYVGEEGTGLGPTLEFYALVAAEFQRKSLNYRGSSVAMWLCDDADEQQLKLESLELDLGEGRKPPGYYVRRSGGLFPAPLPPDSDESLKVSELFRILGIFLAKVLQDGRLVDFPLSSLFLKLLVNAQVAEGSEPNLDALLTIDDFERIHPHKANFLRELSNLVERKKRITADERMPPAAKRQRLEELRLKLGDAECAVEDLALTFALNPPSSVFSYRDYELIPNGAEIDVTVENVEVYLEKCLDFYLNTGIRQQISAFRQGFDLVFPLRSLVSFSPEEVQTLLSGEQCPEWTREDILKHTEPKLGYTRESPGFLRFVDVLVGLNAAERKAFLQFTTGCSSLPPGGLANLHPRLTVVRKVDSGDGSYPSVNTCVHYLKLPEYSSAEILRERLLAATNEKGFHLN